MGGRTNTFSDFWSKIAIKSDDECWLWLFSRDKNGYGYFSFQGKTLKAHKVAYLLTCHGPLQFKYHICHSCDNPSCCNPKHLWAGTSQQNTKDRNNKNRQAKGEAIKKR